ncbi:Cyclic di-GMP phosphodiesterase response regulator RpfG [Planctomycetes bacterium Pan216]|uniref:Cyclic di-GMP phosphodiesterase response regulator RpfG n=1 Tax=Kolteria novifilia TaxID=2527975 RepID=A0A518B2I3_9BACT|nr:Cyclic di-GMP phosphodiesterase response regulator RpfG [Planctomycetes bacterium Pan216]
MAASEALAWDSSKVHLLIVDDEPLIGRLIARWLSKEGYACHVSGSVGDAKELLTSKPISLVICDVFLRDGDGFELLSEARCKDPLAAVILVTGLDDREVGIRALREGAYGYLAKPLSQNEVLINATNALERRRLVMASSHYQQQLEVEVSARTADLVRREEEIVLRLVSASEWRDTETGDHLRRIGLYSAQIADALGWSSERVRQIQLAATMHDLGKIGVPDSILRKPGRLTPDEFLCMERHTTIGAAMLDGSDLSLLQMARDIALSHHERIDGRGYPQGLTGEAIPEAAKIVAIADVYDALRNERVYKPAMDEVETIRVMMSGRGEHFDPQLFDCFLDLLSVFRRINDEVRSDHANQSWQQAFRILAGSV